jgi:lipopolysaccharide/colanic/teichoic acid biosynthesis glycosyltransferase
MNANVNVEMGLTSRWAHQPDQAGKQSELGNYIDLGGYKEGNYLLIRFAEIIFASLCLLLSSPLFIILPILIRFMDNGEVFYCAPRMGKNKRLFLMWKFRTLKPNANQITADRILTPHLRLETPIGRFLRETRLDEIPQFINILRGDMGFFGPRPIRPEVYDSQCRDLPDYEKRFLVRPGLLGYSQLFTPHSTPKRIRSLLDNRFVTQRQTFFSTASLILTSFWILGSMAVQRMILGGRRLLTQYFVRGLLENQRLLERIRPKAVAISLVDSSAASKNGSSTIILNDINEDCMSVVSMTDFGDDPQGFRLEISRKGALPGQIKRKCAYLQGSIIRREVIRSANGTKGYALIISYQAASPLNRYLIDKYCVRKSIF